MKYVQALLLSVVAAFVMPPDTIAAPKTKAPTTSAQKSPTTLLSSVPAAKRINSVNNVLSAIRKNSALSKPLSAIRAKSASGKSLSEQFGRLSKVKKPISLDYIKRVHNEEYAGKVFPASKLSKTFSKRYPAGIRFNERGYPDLSQYATKTVQIEPQGNSAKDARAADIAAGFTKDNPRPGRYYWYHSEQKGTMQLVPKDMIGALRRAGSKPNTVALERVEDTNGPSKNLPSSHSIDIPAPKLSFEQARREMGNFKGGVANEVRYSGGGKLYRIGDRNGAYWATDPPPSTELQWRMDYAVQGEWNNMSNLYILDIPSGSSIVGLEGIAGQQRGALYGGKKQVFLDWKEIPSSWISTKPLRSQ